MVISGDIWANEGPKNIHGESTSDRRTDRQKDMLTL